MKDVIELLRDLSSANKTICKQKQVIEKMQVEIAKKEKIILLHYSRFMVWNCKRTMLKFAYKTLLICVIYILSLQKQKLKL